MTTPCDELTAITLDDLVASFGWEQQRLPALALRRAFHTTARTFAEHMVELDDAVGHSQSLAGPSRRFLRARYVRGLEVEGHTHVPATGPALFVANHPGLVDTLSLFAAIGRNDLKAVALDRPFLRTMRHLSHRMIFTDANLGRRALAAQAVADHLAGGGAVMTFPAGHIEPDPNLGDADGALGRWPDLTRLVARVAPETRIVPIVVRGVACPTFARHWLARFRRTRDARDRLAAALQLIAMVREARPTTVQVRIGAGLDAACFRQERLIASLRRLIIEGHGPQTQTALAGAGDRGLDWTPVNEGVPIR